MTERIDKRSPWNDLAGRALRHGIAGRTDIAHRCVQRLANEYGSDVIPQVLLAWVDTAMLQVWPDGAPVDVENFGGISFWREGTSEITDADAVPPAVRWAGRFFTARLLDDEDQGRALMGSLASDLEWGQAVAATLNVAAAFIRNFGQVPL